MGLYIQLFACSYGEEFVDSESHSRILYFPFHAPGWKPSAICDYLVLGGVA